MPDWPTCAHREATERPCIGRRAEGFDHCLAHLKPQQLDQALKRLQPGADLDASGTPINAKLLAQILHAVQGDGEHPAFGRVSFTQAHFTEDAGFDGAQFSGTAWFSGAQFSGDARFVEAQFSRDARFGGVQLFPDPSSGGLKGKTWFDDTQTNDLARFGAAQFSGKAWFSGAQFSGFAGFDAHFNDEAEFRYAKFSRDAHFSYAQFSRDARFDDAEFNGEGDFRNAKFSSYTCFEHARFNSYTDFDDAQFSGDASFSVAKFSGGVRFDDAQFGGSTWFSGAQFSYAGFDSAQFSEYASFSEAQFGNAMFGRAKFSGDANFDDAKFSDAMFGDVQVTGDAKFEGARFENATKLRPLAASSVSLERAVFVRPLVIEAAAAAVSCRGTTWCAGVTLRLRYAAVDLERATFTAPSFVTGSGQPFESFSGPFGEPLNEDKVRNHVTCGVKPPVDEPLRSPRPPRERGESPDLWTPLLTSLRGSDTANLTITDVDLSRCRFIGARLLDQVRLEGRCIFDHPPRGVRTGWAWPPFWRWSSRQSIAEERTWRATTRKHAGWSKAHSSEPAEAGPERLAGLYRQLRKAEEDAKNEPGAADFYYGEMEMRRRAATTPVGERAILWLYWLISGYGLRALRSLAALLMLGMIVTTVLIGSGLAATAPPQHLAGTVTSSPGNRTRIDATLNTAKPQLPPAGKRWTAQRTRTALEVTLNSIVFRTTDQPLTTAGTWTVDAARILGPVLLALTLLAVRNRVKR